jgi:hypothetical protein
MHYVHCTMQTSSLTLLELRHLQIAKAQTAGTQGGYSYTRHEMLRKFIGLG